MFIDANTRTAHARGPDAEGREIIPARPSTLDGQGGLGNLQDGGTVETTGEFLLIPHPYLPDRGRSDVAGVSGG